MYSQQLIALHHLCLVVLAVVAQQLPEEENKGGVEGTVQTGTLCLNMFPLGSHRQGHDAHPSAGQWHQAREIDCFNPSDHHIPGTTLQQCPSKDSSICGAPCASMGLDPSVKPTGLGIAYL